MRPPSELRRCAELPRIWQRPSVFGLHYRPEHPKSGAAFWAAGFRWPSTPTVDLELRTSMTRLGPAPSREMPALGRSKPLEVNETTPRV